MNKKLEKKVTDYIKNTGLYIGDYNGGSFLIVDTNDEVKDLENIVNDSDIGKVLCELGIISTNDSWGFSCEYTTCSNCCKIVSLYSYGNPEYLILDEGLLCLDCVSIDDEVELCNNDPNRGLVKTTVNDLIDRDWDIYKRAEAGLYDYSIDPREVFKEAKANGHDNVIFVIEGVSQFSTSYVCMIKDDEE